MSQQVTSSQKIHRYKSNDQPWNRSSKANSTDFPRQQKRCTSPSQKPSEGVTVRRCSHSPCAFCCLGANQKHQGVGVCFFRFPSKTNQMGGVSLKKHTLKWACPCGEAATWTPSSTSGFRPKFSPQAPRKPPGESLGLDQVIWTEVRWFPCKSLSKPCPCDLKSWVDRDRDRCLPPDSRG